MGKSLLHIKNIKISTKYKFTNSNKDILNETCRVGNTCICQLYHHTRVLHRSKRQRFINRQRHNINWSTKSSMAFSNLLFSITQVMEKVPGCLHLYRMWGTNLPINAYTFLPMVICSWPFKMSLSTFQSFCWNYFRREWKRDGGLLQITTSRRCTRRRCTISQMRTFTYMTLKLGQQMYQTSLENV